MLSLLEGSRIRKWSLVPCLVERGSRIGSERLVLVSYSCPVFSADRVLIKGI